MWWLEQLGHSVLKRGEKEEKRRRRAESRGNEAALRCMLSLLV